MALSIADQIALDDALVAPADRLRIGKCNLRLSSDVTSKEATLQVVYDVLKLTPFYNAFQVTADAPEIYMQEFWASAYVHNRSVRFKMNNKKHIIGLEQFRDILQICPRVGNKKFVDPPLEKEMLIFLASLGHSGDIRKLTDVNVNKLHQPWRSFAAVINKCLCGTPSYDSLRLSQAQILWEGQCDVRIFVHQYVSHHLCDGKILNSLDEQGQLKQILLRQMEASRKLLRHNQSTKASSAPPREKKSGKAKQKTADEGTFKKMMRRNRTESDDDGDDFVHPKLTTHDDEIIHEEDTDEDDSNISSSDEQDSDDEVEGTNVEGAKSDERDKYDKMGEDTHVTLTPVNPDGQQQSSSVSSGFVSNMLNPNQDTGVDDIFRQHTKATSLIDTSVTAIMEPSFTAQINRPPTHAFYNSGKQYLYDESTSPIIPSTVDQYLANKMQEAVDVAVQLKYERIREESTTANQQFLDSIDDGMKKIIKEQVKKEVELELKKILIDRWKLRTSFNRPGVRTGVQYELQKKRSNIFLTGFKNLRGLPSPDHAWNKSVPAVHETVQPCSKKALSTGLRIPDIEDMLLLLVQGKVTNLSVEERIAFNVSLRMFTRRVVIQRRVEDLQLGVESYQKKLNLTKPDTYRSNLRRKDAYSPFSDPRGFIYENKDKKNRLMRIDELHKFSDGTLNDVRTVLNDRLKGIRMEYLPETFWSQRDKANARAMIQAIDKRLKTRRIMRSLERFVGGRPYGVDIEKVALSSRPPITKTQSALYCMSTAKKRIIPKSSLATLAILLAKSHNLEIPLSSDSSQIEHPYDHRSILTDSKYVKWLVEGFLIPAGSQRSHNHMLHYSDDKHKVIMNAHVEDSVEAPVPVADEERSVTIDVEGADVAAQSRIKMLKNEQGSGTEAVKDTNYDLMEEITDDDEDTLRWETRRGSKRRRSGKEPASTSAPSETTTKTAGQTTDTDVSERPADQEFETGVQDEQAEEEVQNSPDWFQKPTDYFSDHAWNTSVPGVHEKLSTTLGTEVLAHKTLPESFDYELTVSSFDLLRFCAKPAKHVQNSKPELLAGPNI
ncbi:hypothetical protein Tco_1311160 [Tanacetum coccineum]